MKNTYVLIAFSLSLYLGCLSPAVSQQLPASPAPSTTIPQQTPQASESGTFAALDAYKQFNEEIERLNRDTDASIGRLKQLDRDWPTLASTVDHDLTIAQRTIELYSPNGELANAMHLWLDRAKDLRHRAEENNEQQIVANMDKQIKQLEGDLQRLPGLYEQAKKNVSDLRRAQGTLTRLKEAAMIGEAGQLIHNLADELQGTVSAGAALRDRLSKLGGPGV